MSELVAKRLQVALQAAKEAGDYLIRTKREIAVDKKGARDLVTTADRGSEAIIRQILINEFPTAGAIADPDRTANFPQFRCNHLDHGRVRCRRLFRRAWSDHIRFEQDCLTGPDESLPAPKRGDEPFDRLLDLGQLIITTIDDSDYCRHDTPPEHKLFIAYPATSKILSTG